MKQVKVESKVKWEKKNRLHYLFIRVRYVCAGTLGCSWKVITNMRIGAESERVRKAENKRLPQHLPPSPLPKASDAFEEV